MRTKQITTRLAMTAGLVLAGWHGASLAVDSASLEFATGNKSTITRLGAQWDWSAKWLQSSSGNLGGYWDLTAARIEENRYRNIAGNKESIYDLGITPVFRYQGNDKLGAYAEAGIGAHVFSSLYDNNGRRFSTAFEFGDHLGVGYVFANRWELGLKVQHFSNGGIKHPNSGANFAVIKAAYRF